MLDKSGTVSVLAEVRDCLHEHLLHILSSLAAIEISRKQVSMNFASPLFQTLSKLHNSHNLYANHNPAMHQLLACHLPARFKVSSVVKPVVQFCKNQVPFMCTPSTDRPAILHKCKATPAIPISNKLAIHSREP